MGLGGLVVLLAEAPSGLLDPLAGVVDGRQLGRPGRRVGKPSGQVDTPVQRRLGGWGVLNTVVAATAAGKSDDGGEDTEGDDRPGDE